VKSVSLSPLLERCQIEIEIESLFNLRYRLIDSLVGFVFPAELGGRWELKGVRLHATGFSFADVLSNPPAWRTPMAKAVLGMALALGFGFQSDPP
jgi:hypothetical protein